MLRKDMAQKKRVELHLHTKMSGDAVLSLEEAFEKACEWGHSAIAITDHSGVRAFPEAMRLSEKYGVKAIFGVEVFYKETKDNDFAGYHQTILVKNQKGLKNLYRLLSKGYPECMENGHPVYSRAILEEYREGLLFGSGCGRRELFSALTTDCSPDVLERIVTQYDYLEIFPTSAYRDDVKVGLLES